MRNTAFTRQCLACRERKNKNELIRFVKQKNLVELDKFNKINSRGAYVCKNKECIKKVEDKNLLNRAFKMQLTNENKQIIFKELKEFVGE